MRVTRIETIDHDWALWVRIHTDDGLIGLGETYLYHDPARTLIENRYGPKLIGEDPTRIEAFWRHIFEQFDFVGVQGAEMRAMSALDMAMWDLLGQACGKPIYQLLGGACRDRIKIYNTCGEEEGLDFMINPDEFAQDLLANGIRAMKIWPYDGLALESDGHYISLPDLKKGLEPIRKIREAVGDEIDIAVEFHGHWDLQCAVRIAQSLEPYNVMWLEDIMHPENLDAYEHLSRATRLPLTVSERLQTRYAFLPVMQRQIPRVIMPDVVWCGGITEAKKISDMADTFNLPVAFHNFGGPINNFASAQVAAAIPNLMIMETGRCLLNMWTDEFITHPIVIEDGHMKLPEGPGIGTGLSEAVLKRDDVQVNVVEG